MLRTSLAAELFAGLSVQRGRQDVCRSSTRVPRAVCCPNGGGSVRFDGSDEPVCRRAHLADGARDVAPPSRTSSVRGVDTASRERAHGFATPDASGTLSSPAEWLGYGARVREERRHIAAAALEAARDFDGGRPSRSPSTSASFVRIKKPRWGSRRFAPRAGHGAEVECCPERADPRMAGPMSGCC